MNIRLVFTAIIAIAIAHALRYLRKQSPRLATRNLSSPVLIRPTIDSLFFHRLRAFLTLRSHRFGLPFGFQWKFVSRYHDDSSRSCFQKSISGWASISYGGMARRKEKNERNAFFVVRGSGRKRRRVATAHRVCTKRLLSSFRAYRETKSSDLCQSVGDSRAPRIPRSRVHPLKSSSLPIFLSFFFFFSSSFSQPRRISAYVYVGVRTTCARNVRAQYVSSNPPDCSVSLYIVDTWSEDVAMGEWGKPYRV